MGVIKSYTSARDADNRRLEKEGKPYRFDIAGYMRCAICWAYWDEREAPNDWKPCAHAPAVWGKGE